MEEQYEYAYINKPTRCIENNKIVDIDNILNNYARQGYKVIHITYDVHLNRYACILERKIIKKQN